MKAKTLLTNLKKIKKLTGEYYKLLCANKIDNLDKKEKFPETYKLPKLTQEETENLNRSFNKSDKRLGQQSKPSKEPGPGFTGDTKFHW